MLFSLDKVFIGQTVDVHEPKKNSGELYTNAFRGTVIKVVNHSYAIVEDMEGNVYGVDYTNLDVVD